MSANGAVAGLTVWMFPVGDAERAALGECGRRPCLVVAA
jgi:hypothetical protein